MPEEQAIYMTQPFRSLVEILKALQVGAGFKAMQTSGFWFILERWLVQGCLL